MALAKLPLSTIPLATVPHTYFDVHCLVLWVGYNIYYLQKVPMIRMVVFHIFQQHIGEEWHPYISNESLSTL